MEHEIVQDLLPLYHDGVCSEKSRAAVEEHLKECPDCRAALEAMDAPLPETEKRAANDAAVVRGISEKVEKGKRKAWLKGAAIALAVCLVLVSVWHLLTKVNCVPVAMEDIRITELARLKDGRVVFHMFIDDEKDLRRVRYEYDDAGDLHIVPIRPVLIGKREMSVGLWDADEITDLAEHNTWNVQHGNGEEATRIYLGRGEDAVLLWEEGMDLPAASAEQEALWGYEPGSAAYWAERE